MQTYTVISQVYIRREPKIVEVKQGKRIITNIVGSLNVGTSVLVFEKVTDKATWGRVSEPDSAGIANWVCIRTLNRAFLKEQSVPVTSAESRLQSLEAWARTKGYSG